MRNFPFYVIAIYNVLTTNTDSVVILIYNKLCCHWYKYNVVLAQTVLLNDIRVQR